MFEYYNNTERQCRDCKKWYAEDKGKKIDNNFYCFECYNKIPYSICQYTGEKCFYIQCYAGDCVQEEFMNQESQPPY